MKTLGLDVGTNSIGWAVVNDHGSAGEKSDVACGSYVFPEAGELDDGLYESHRRKRGIKRRMRRNLARKRQRRDQLVRLLRANGFELVDLVELFADENTPDHTYYTFSREWSEQWPFEEIWRARLRRR